MLMPNSEIAFVVMPSDRLCWIHAFIAGFEVARASYKECGDPDRRELVEVETTGPRRRGYGSAVLRHLAEMHPQMPLVNSPDEVNSELGRRLVASVRRKGVRIHDFGCFRNGLGCVCPLAIT